MCSINPSHRTAYPMLFWLHPSKVTKKDSDKHKRAVHLRKKQERGLHVGPSFQAKSRVYVCMHVYTHVRTIPESRDMYATLFRARKELGFSVVFQFSHAITGREREREWRGEARKGRFLTKPDPSIFFQKQELELICDSFSCLTGTSREPQSLCREEHMTPFSSFCFGFKFKQKLNLKTKPLQLMYNLRF